MSATQCKEKFISYGEWIAASFVVVTALIVWNQVRLTGAANLTIYDIFPLFGIIAFGLMWTHFLFGAIRRYTRVERPKKHLYSTVSMGIVLAMILLHPGLLWFALWRDGFGLPPGSYLTVYSTQLLAVISGTIGLCIFLAYELKRLFGEKTWWRYVEYLQIVGMVAIFYHSLELGGEVDVVWFEVIWWLYFITFIVAICYTSVSKFRGDRAV
jgi:hypothetical protein